MNSTGSSPHQDHLFKVGVLLDRSTKPYPRTVRDESSAEILRYRDEGLANQKERDNMGSGPIIPMTRSGMCAFESVGSHAMCRSQTCTCECHLEQKAFSGRGILFAVIDDREKMRKGKTTTVEIIAAAIDAALDKGKDTPEEIARFLTTSAFQHIPDKRVRFNSVLKAGDTVGAQIVKKLFNSYNELMDTAEDEKDPDQRATLEAEARGFAEAIQVVMNPFSVEDETDPTLIKWDEVDHITELFEKEQKERRDWRRREGSKR